MHLTCFMCFFLFLKLKTAVACVAFKCGFIFWKLSVITTKHRVFFCNKYYCSPNRIVLAWKESCKKNVTCNGDSLAPIIFLLSLQWSPPWLLKCLITNTFFEFSNIITEPLLCCSFIYGFKIEVVKEARTFCILQLHKESTGNNRQGRNMAMMQSTSHCSASWATFTYINCWWKHDSLL